MKKDELGNLMGKCANCGHAVFSEEAGYCGHDKENGDTQGNNVCTADDDGDECGCASAKLEIGYAEITVAELAVLAEKGYEFILDASEQKIIQVI